MITPTNNSYARHFFTDDLIDQLLTLNDQIDIDPQSIELRFQRTCIYIRLEDWHVVLHESEEIAYLDPAQTAITLAVCGMAHAKLLDYEAAYAAIAQSLALNPNDPATYALRADVHAMQTNWLETVNDYSIALSLDPSVLTARIERARAYIYLGRMEDAKADFELAKLQFCYNWERINAETYLFGQPADLWDGYQEDYVYLYDDDRNDDGYWTCAEDLDDNAAPGFIVYDIEDEDVIPF